MKWHKLSSKNSKVCIILDMGERCRLLVSRVLEAESTTVFIVSWRIL
jgi:hypothetical protein